MAAAAMTIMILLMLSLSLVLLLPASTQQYGNALRLTGYQYFSDGTGIAYFDDGTMQPFKHMITSANGYYFDNSTIFYTGEIPGLSSERVSSAIQVQPATLASMVTELILLMSP